jgi:hypothetical protein
VKSDFDSNPKGAGQHHDQYLASDSGNGVGRSGGDSHLRGHAGGMALSLTNGYRRQPNPDFFLLSSTASFQGAKPKSK